jgi:Spy/CpxP family protein refolding chaperone
VSIKRVALLGGFLALLLINISWLGMILYGRLHPHPMGCAMPPAEHVSTMRSQLGLTDKQVEQLGDLRREFGKMNRPLIGTLRENRLALMRELKGAMEPDSERIEQLIDTIGQLETQLHRQSIAFMLRERSTLTGPQQRLFFEIFEHHICKQRKDGFGPGAEGIRRHPGGEDGSGARCGMGR